MPAGRRGRVWAGDSVTTASGGTAGALGAPVYSGPGPPRFGIRHLVESTVTVARPRDDGARAAGSRRRGGGLAPALAVVLVAVAGLLLGGVTVLELLRYGAWLAVVLAAGWAAWRAFAAAPGGALEQVAMGGAVGFGLSTAIGAIVLAAGVEQALPFVLLAV